MPYHKSDFEGTLEPYAYKWKLHLRSWMGWKDSIKITITIQIIDFSKSTLLKLLVMVRYVRLV